ncbi:MAG: hypothetical protein IT289_08655 [Oligoflexia bacterium]|nr:hypothetical protein [Oligoflexia bacterium]
MSTEPKSNKREILRDHVTVERYKALNYAISCEECSHFDAQTEHCTFGFPTLPHLKRTQIEDLNKDGWIAFCRAMEID